MKTNRAKKEKKHECAQALLFLLLPLLLHLDKAPTLVLRAGEEVPPRPVEAPLPGETKPKQQPESEGGRTQPTSHSPVILS